MNKIWSLPFESLQSNNKWSSYHLTGTVSVCKFHTAPQGREDGRGRGLDGTSLTLERRLQWQWGGILEYQGQETN